MKNEAYGVEICNGQNRVGLAVIGYVEENKQDVSGKQPEDKHNSERLSLQHDPVVRASWASCEQENYACAR